MNKLIKTSILTYCVLMGQAAYAAEFIVKMNPILAEGRINSLSEDLSALLGAKTKILYKLGSLEHAYVVEVNDQVARTKGVDQLLSAARSAPFVEWVVENTLYRRHAAVVPNDALYSSQRDYLGSNKSGSVLIDQAWGVSRGSYSVVIAVLDSGLLFDHPDMQGKSLPGYSFFRNSALDKGVGPGPNAIDPGNYLTEEESARVPSCGGAPATPSDWHGTRVASVAAATTNDAQGIAGASWNSRILPVRVTGPCGASLADVLDGLSWAGGLPVSGVPTNQSPAKIINMSFGSSNTTCPTPLQTVINRLVEKNVVVVASAGNDNGPITDPAVCTGVIRVGSTTNDGLKSGFSNYGSNTSIFAPGGNKNRSEGIQVASNTGVQGPSKTFNVTSETGTSFSAPLVSGVIANMLTVNPQLTPAQIESILKTTARPFPPSTVFCPSPSSATKTGNDCTCTRQTCGSGILNAFEALRSARNTLPVSNPGSVRTVKTSTTVVDGDSSSVANGRSIAAYKWTLLSGNASLVNADTANLTVNALSNNNQAVLRLTVTDSAGMSAQSDTAVNFMTNTTTPPPAGDESGQGSSPRSVVEAPKSNGGGGTTSLPALAVLALLMARLRLGKFPKLRFL